MKKWLVIEVSHRAESVSKPHCIGVTDTFQEAQMLAHKSILEWVKANQDEGVEYNLDKLAAWYDYDDSDSYELSIQEVTV